MMQIMQEVAGMDEDCIKHNIEGWAYGCLLGAVFASGFSMPVGRTLFVICLVLLLTHLFKVRKALVLSSLFWFWLLFVAVAFLATAMGVDPATGFSKIQKLAWFIGIPVCATLVTSFQRLSSVLGAYAIGTGVEALRTIIMNPIHAARMVKAGKLPDFMSALINEGSMTYAQILMLGIVIVLGFIFIRRHEQRPAIGWWILLLLQTVALIMMFKRGSWVCTCLLVTVFLALKTNWKYLVVLILVVMASFALPPVRARVAGLKNEFNSDSGGRMTMWLKITPALFKEHPWLGIGYRVLTPEMMQKIDRNVERNRNHLHSNIAQVLVDMGITGLVIYLLWMGKAMFDAGSILKCSAKSEFQESTLSIVLILLIVGLFANGLVEYNFGDAEIVLAYGLVMGCIGAMRNVMLQRASLTR